jgi:hypothetical protein
MTGKRARFLPSGRLLHVVVGAALVTFSGLAVAPLPVAASTTFVVNRIGDAPDLNLANAKCDASTASGNQCTLRAAIQEANDTGGQITINFHITSSSKVIAPATPLPQILASTTINGYSQTGASPNTVATGNNAVLKIVLDGINAGSTANGLDVNGSGSIVRGLVIQRFGGAGLLLSGYKVDAFGNFVGTTSLGTAARGNVVGVRVTGDQADVGTALPADRNVISGNQGDGVLVEASSGYSNIVGNYIGVRKSGAVALPNGGNGIRIDDAEHTRVGGTAAGSRNIISGNAAAGIQVTKDSGASDTVIIGNFIGTNSAGTAAVGNVGDGVYTDALSVRIGDVTAGSPNVISGNGSSGIELHDSDTNIVQGNLIGTKADGTGNLGNTDGITMNGSADDNTIGGTTNAAGNVIANSDFDGLFLTGGIHNAIQRNVVRNNTFHGLLINAVVVNVSGNTLVQNGEDGVEVSGNVTGVAISANQIFANGALGIDLHGGTEDSYKTTANDTDDPDTGPNGLQNTPVLSGAVRQSNGVTNVIGTLDSLASTQFRVEIFFALVDGSGHGEGQVFFGAQNVTTNSSGDVSFSIPVGGLQAGMVLTATVTTVSGGNTSEFSNNVTVVAA